MSSVKKADIKVWGKKNKKELIKLAIRDDLTGLYNRRYFDTQINQLMTQKTPFGLMLLDIDHFKKLNDEYGHPAGDSILQEVSRIFQNNIRVGTGDFVARYGGEEFAIVFPKMDIDVLSARSEKIRQQVEDYNFRLPENQKVKTTISGGFRVWDNQEPFVQVIEDVDKALYKAKKSGRNKVIEAVKSK